MLWSISLTKLTPFVKHSCSFWVIMEMFSGIKVRILSKNKAKIFLEKYRLRFTLILRY